MNPETITPEVVSAHNLTVEEFARIKELLPHERMYRVAKARLRDVGSPAVDADEAPVEEVRRTPPRSRVGSPVRSTANGSRR